MTSLARTVGLRFGARARTPVGLSLVGKLAEGMTLAGLLVILPRALGPVDYGRFALALALFQIGGASVALGGPGLMSRFVPAADPGERPAVARALLRRVVRWRALGVVAVAGVAALVAVVAPQRVAPTLAALVVAAIAMDSAATMLGQAALGLGRTTFWSFRWPMQHSVLIVAALLLAVPFGALGAVAAIAVAAGSVALVALLVVAEPLRRARRDASPPPGALRFGALQAVVGLLAIVTTRGGVAAVAVLDGSRAETGFAGLAIAVALFGTFAVGQAFVVQLPGLSARAVADPAGAESQGRTLAALATLAVVPVVLAVAAMLDPLVTGLLGADFRDAVPALAVGLALLPLAPVAAFAAQTADLRLRPALRVAAAGLAAAVFVGVALAAVPAWGAVGAVAALLAGTLSAALLLSYALRDAVGWALPAAAIAGSGLTLLIGQLAA
jgi:O-antigen/teichoic acid export membrane protein